MTDQARAAQQEVEWAHDVLDTFGAPRTTPHPEGGTVTLNLAGRIHHALNPKNVPLDEWRANRG